MVAEIFYFSYFEVIFHLRSSSIWGRLPFEVILISYISTLGCFHVLKFFWARSDQWLLRYSTFRILRSSSIWGRLPSEVIFIWYLCTLCVVPTSLSFNFDQNPTSGCWENWFLKICLILVTHTDTRYMNAGVAFGSAGIWWVLAGKLGWANWKIIVCQFCKHQPEAQKQTQTFIYQREW